MMIFVGRLDATKPKPSVDGTVIQSVLQEDSVCFCKAVHFVVGLSSAILNYYLLNSLKTLGYSFVPTYFMVFVKKNT
jgi:hypothetical protein